MSREAAEQILRDAKECARKAGKEVTERELRRLIMPAVEQADRSKQGNLGKYRGGERKRNVGR